MLAAVLRLWSAGAARLCTQQGACTLCLRWTCSSEVLLAQEWELVSSGGESEHGAFVELRLRDDDETRAAWPHAFALALRVSLSQAGTLRLDLSVQNTGTDAPLGFTTALHTYFRCDALRSRVLGLRGKSYLDSLQARQKFTEQAEHVAFDREVDRIYLDVGSGSLTLVDDAASRSFAVAPFVLPDAVVWNPWLAKAASMADFGDDEYKDMVCIEAAAIEKPVVLAPGEHWKGGQTLSLHNGRR